MKVRRCKICGASTRSARIYCANCRKLKKSTIPDMTVAQSIQEYKKFHGAALYSLIRCRARTVAINANRTKCEICGYDKHFDVCHIKHIALFPEDTLISVVNDPSNIIVLCPNHHRELDNNMLPNIKNCSANTFSNKCLVCGTPTNNKKYCSYECLGLARRRVARPTKEDLVVLLESNSMSAISRSFKVSPNTIKAWKIKYGI